MHAQPKMTTPSRRTRGRAMASHFDFRGGKTRIVCENHEGSLREKAHRVPQQNQFM